MANHDDGPVTLPDMVEGECIPAAVQNGIPENRSIRRGGPADPDRALPSAAESLKQWMQRNRSGRQDAVLTIVLPPRTHPPLPEEEET